MPIRNKLSRLMLVDDDELDHIYCARKVKNSGLVEDYISFYYAEEALEYLKNPSSPKVDIIALDINMPRMDGFEFLEQGIEQLGESFAGAKVVMLTTSTSEADKIRARGFTVVSRYFNKPLSDSQLEEMMQLLENA